MTTIELFLKLVRNALWHTEEELPEELSEKMMANIFRGGHEQGLLGLVTDALIRNKVRMPQEKHLETMVLLEKVKQGNEKMSEGLRCLKELFDSRGIDYLVVKGQAVGAYYPNPMLRQAGDIDYYCDARNFPKAQESIRKLWGIDAKSYNYEHHICFDYEGVTYEGHFVLTKFYNKKTDQYWQQLVDEDRGCTVMINGIKVRTLSPTLHALFVFIHLYKHLLNQGVSFRQFCDLAVLLHYCHKEMDYEQLHEILKTVGLQKAYRAIGCVLTDCLGMSAKDLGCELTDKDRQFVKHIYAIVKSHGNMGHHNLHHPEIGWKHSVEVAGMKLSHFAKLWQLAPGYSCRWIIHEFTRRFF